MDNVKVFEQSTFNCPDCGGGLCITTKDNPNYFRCFAGHFYKDRDLMVKQAETMEPTLWTALRMMEECRSLLMQFHDKEVKKVLKTSAIQHLSRAEEMARHIDNRKQVLFQTKGVD